ncbi:hypothetical protein ACC754_38920, partial [Rhizobium johnstonii]
VSVIRPVDLSLSLKYRQQKGRSHEIQQSHLVPIRLLNKLDWAEFFGGTMTARRRILKSYCR